MNFLNFIPRLTFEIKLKNSRLNNYNHAESSTKQNIKKKKGLHIRSVGVTTGRTRRRAVSASRSFAIEAASSFPASVKPQCERKKGEMRMDTYIHV